jgi:hypothetical protein
MKALILITTLWAITMFSSANASTMGERVLADQVGYDFKVAAIETIEGKRLLTNTIVVDGKFGAIGAKKLLESGQIESIRSGEILYPEEIKYLFSCKVAKRGWRSQGKRPGVRPGQQIGDGGEVAKEPHTDGWPINNGGGNK